MLMDLGAVAAMAHSGEGALTPPSLPGGKAVSSGAVGASVVVVVAGLSKRPGIDYDRCNPPLELLSYPSCLPIMSGFHTVTSSLIFGKPAYSVGDGFEEGKIWSGEVR